MTQRAGRLVAAMSVIAMAFGAGIDGARAAAQSSAVGVGQAAPVAFDVSSAKPNKSGDNAISFSFLPSGLFSATNVTLRDLIRQAYRLPENDHLLLGGPSWMTSDRFDVVARAPAGTTLDQSFAMLRSLLTEQFKLIAHRETRELPIYRLVVDRADRKLGPQLRASEAGCAAERAAAASGGPPTPAKGYCGTRAGRGELTMGGRTVPQVADRIARYVDRPVVDGTGLNGEFDATLKWTPDQPTREPPADPAVGVGIFTALREQWGLRLEPSRDPVDVLVVDSAERPVE